MAMIGRKQPVAPSPVQSSPKPRVAAGSGGSDNSRLGKIRGNIRDISAELRKVTWPTREEARNLTIVVIGITAFLGSLLASIDTVLAKLYQVIHP